MKVLSTINHEPGFSTHISFDQDDVYFVAGGILTGNLNIYDLWSMKLVKTIDNHIGT